MHNYVDLFSFLSNYQPTFEMSNYHVTCIAKRKKNKIKCNLGTTYDEVMGHS